MITAQSGIDTEENMTESFNVLYFPVIRTLWEEFYSYIYSCFYVQGQPAGSVPFTVETLSILLK